jgi:hypothetical protein
MGLRPTQGDETDPDEQSVGGPGLAFETWVPRVQMNPFARRNPGLKIETWATH